jgi:hypothetical protein
MRTPLLYKIWKTLDEGLSMIEEAATIVGTKARRLERGVYVGGALIQPASIPMRYPVSSNGKLQGFKTFEVLKDETGKPSLGKTLYEGIDPVMAVRYAVGKVPTK